MTDLTLEELAFHESSIGSTYDGELHLTEGDARALLAMARELIRIRSALAAEREVWVIEGADGLPQLAGTDKEQVDATHEACDDSGERVVRYIPDPLSPPATPVAELKGGE